MNYLQSICSILKAHERSNRRTGRTNVRIYAAWIHKFSTHFISYQCNHRTTGVYAQGDPLPFYIGRTDQGIRSRINGHIRVFLKNIIRHLQGKPIWMNAYQFVRWCNLFANNQPVTVRKLSDTADDENGCIMSYSEVYQLTNMAELPTAYHSDRELELSNSARAIIEHKKRLPYHSSL